MTRQREPRQRNREYLGFIARLPCVACACAGRAVFGVEVAHFKAAIFAHGWREAGLSEKSHDEARAFPLCPEHHRGKTGEHMNGQRAYWDSLGICPGCLGTALFAAYEAGENGFSVIQAAVRGRRRDGKPLC